ncbi:hypothetical protein JOD45_001318 [Scopulibacillus daqui]|uniref:Uncharacterized protein n=1 Tax=Scopulibacillus daqui TaxID=1469162 RepID=A0ABS2PYL0_9BACL|nr:hypothetical protein [Scopulibacillus daqui]MBM7645107.1 hypothetical protein [Scopulibacillus daqui]
MDKEQPFSKFPAMKIAKINLETDDCESEAENADNLKLCPLKLNTSHLSETAASIFILIANPELQLNIDTPHSLKHLADHITDISWRLEKLHCDMPAQSNHLFSKGTLSADIEYVPKGHDSVLSERAYVPFQAAAHVHLLNPPHFSPQNQSREYTFESKSSDKQYKNREQIIYGPSVPLTYRHHWTRIVSTETCSDGETTGIQFQLNVTISVLIFQQQLVDIT